MQLGKVRAAQQLVKGKEGIVIQRDPETVLNRAQWKRGPPERPMVPKAYRVLRSVTCQFSCGQTGGCRRVDARYALAVWTLTFGPLAVETSVRRTPVTLGIGRNRYWRGMVRETTRSTEPSNARRKHRLRHGEKRL
jgi:hypothetical protein